ncbi:MAG: hypothetical protein HXY25_13300 [Alphaproteobacteria bacterium]|nr:hypothetical protein [Alphaproteobacteria bacterium]
MMSQFTGAKRRHPARAAGLLAPMLLALGACATAGSWSSAQPGEELRLPEIRNAKWLATLGDTLAPVLARVARSEPGYRVELVSAEAGAFGPISIDEPAAGATVASWTSALGGECRRIEVGYEIDAANEALVCRVSEGWVHVRDLANLGKAPAPVIVSP